MSLSNKVLIALIAGILVGLLLNYTSFSTDPWFANNILDGLFKVVGKLFINALKMLVVPLVLFSLIPGILGIGDIRLLGRIGTKTVVLYLFTTALAITTAIIFAVTSGIGKGMQLPAQQAEFTGKAPGSFGDIITSIVPTNPISAMANGDMLAVIFFAILFGVALLSVAKQSKQLIRPIEQTNEVIMQMVNMVMWFAPYAVFCLVAKAIAELGLDLLTQLFGYVIILIAALLFHTFITQSLLLKTLTGLNLSAFLKKIRTTQLFAFSTSSSAATIPVTLRTTQQRLGVDKSVASFSIPFGATINMDGTAIMQGVATVFIANLYAIDLSISQYLMVIITAVLASIGTAGVPSVGLVMLTLVFNQVGLPVEGIAIILGVDRLLDMIRTVVNVTGDAVVTTIVANSESRLDKAVYNDPGAGIIEGSD